jgi:putative ABC transport system permease protein
MRELQYAFRRLRGSSMFTIAATLTMAISATGSVFGVVDGVLLKAFPYRDPDRVLTLWESSPQRQLPQITVSHANYLDWRAQNTVFTTLAAASVAQFTLTGRQEAERIVGAQVTPSYFSVLGITPVLGRGLAPDSGGPAEVVIGYGFWQRRFGGITSAVGQQLRLNIDWQRNCTRLGHRVAARTRAGESIHRREPARLHHLCRRCRRLRGRGACRGNYTDGSHDPC